MNKRTVVRCVLLALAFVTVTPVFYREVTGASILHAFDGAKARERQHRDAYHQLCRNLLIGYVEAGERVAAAKVEGWRILAKSEVEQREAMLEQAGIAYLDADCRTGPLLGAITLVRDMQNVRGKGW